MKLERSVPSNDPYTTICVVYKEYELWYCRRQSFMSSGASKVPSRKASYKDIEYWIDLLAAFNL